MSSATREQIEQEHSEWRLQQLVDEARDTETAGRREPTPNRIHSRLQEIGGDFGLFRR